MVRRKRRAGLLEELRSLEEQVMLLNTKVEKQRTAIELLKDANVAEAEAAAMAAAEARAAVEAARAGVAEAEARVEMQNARTRELEEELERGRKATLEAARLVLDMEGATAESKAAVLAELDGLLKPRDE